MAGSVMRVSTFDIACLYVNCVNVRVCVRVG